MHLKIIYPHKPKSFKKVNKGRPIINYYAKDIQYLAHEPLLVSSESSRPVTVKKAKKVYIPQKAGLHCIEHWTKIEISYMFYFPKCDISYT